MCLVCCVLLCSMCVPGLSYSVKQACWCREAADVADKAVGEAAMVADAARADEIAAKRELYDLRQQLTEQLAASSRLVNSQDETIHSLYSQLEVCRAYTKLTVVCSMMNRPDCSRYFQGNHDECAELSFISLTLLALRLQLQGLHNRQQLSQNA